ncbi:Putative odorant receptor 13a [Habropoda laboriosa]|uniref:Odorant receptor n=1 Tax=Habropoda laboriosa TaxID=597456 RepID=A0A0L7QKI9_9HYME|nr:PREDICTED: odorant receptor 13a-like [Habropoda laboriosa]KOC59144.1 Putative odorant receptor 13a [Habropoda laboriosa]
MKGKDEGGEFDRLIGLNLDLLRLCGVIPCGSGFLGRNGLACVAFGCLTVYSISYTYQFVTCMENLDTIFESFTMIISIVGGQARFSILSWFRGTCRTMLEACEFLWSTLKPREKEIVRSYANKTRLLTRCYLASCVFTIFIYGVFALFDQSQPSPENLSENGTVDSTVRRLPYVFFLEVQQTPWYEITCALQLFAMLNVGITCVGVDTIGPLFVLLTCAHFDVIRSRIESLHAIDRSSSSVQTRNLRVLVIRHRMLLEFCQDIERVTNVMFFTQLFGSTYNISLVGFKLIGDDPDKYKYISQLSIAIIQLFLCNWPADFLYSKSEAIGRAAYTVPWHWYPRCLRKPTNMLMIRGQKPVRLTAGKIVGLSLETFASMISSAVSFFTVVRTMN